MKIPFLFLRSTQFEMPTSSGLKTTSGKQLSTCSFWFSTILSRKALRGCRIISDFLFCEWSRDPGPCSPCARTNWTLKALAGVWMGTRTLWRHSAISFTNSLCEHRNWSRRKSVSPARNYRPNLEDNHPLGVARWSGVRTLTQRVLFPTSWAVRCTRRTTPQLCPLFSSCSFALWWLMTSRLDRALIRNLLIWDSPRSVLWILRYLAFPLRPDWEISGFLYVILEAATDLDLTRFRSSLSIWRSLSSIHFCSG
jgi:hypothetical protein